MKKTILPLILSIFLVSSCGVSEGTSISSSSSSIEGDTSSTEKVPSSTDGESSITEGSTSSSSTSEGGFVPESDNDIQGMPILHCFNWSISNISSNLEQIKDSGYGAIQLSPMQPQKDYYQGQNWKSQWWKLYQPLGFKVAGSNENVMGTKSELTSLCSKAKNLGIKVIVDVVSNHLAGGSRTSLNGSVNNFEPTIYSQNLIHTYGDWAKDNNLQSIVQGNIGDYPDLKTESSVVQDRVISLLKEYIDCGIDGFRFDAAKHIETPDDGDYASNYWPNVLGATSEYAKTKGREEPYYYGEILTTCGAGREYSSYTKYMSTIDKDQGMDVLNAVINKSTTKIVEQYNTKVSPSKLVIWAESHDTYSNDEKETTNVTTENIQKAYLIQGSRKDASTLYLARPGNSTFGEIGTSNWKDKEIKAINKFHTIFKNQDERIASTSGVFVNVRGSSNYSGAALVNISNASSTLSSLSIAGLPNGTYTDLISGKEYTVSSSVVSNVTFTNNACILVNNDIGDVTAPSLEISASEEVFKDTTSISVNAKNADSLEYQIDNNSPVTFTGSTLTLPTSISSGRFTLKISAKNKVGTTSKELTLIKTSSLYNKSLIIYNIDTNYKYYGWLWKDSGEGSWLEFNIDNNLMGLDMGSNNMFIIVKFNKSVSSIDWSTKVEQTENISFNKRIYNFNDFTFKK